MMKATHPKKEIRPFNCYALAIHEVTLIEIFLPIYKHSKVQDLMDGSRKTSFLFLSLVHMSVCTYFRPNIHENGPENLGVKCTFLKSSDTSKLHED
jgi:hypothetical protein